MTTQLATTITPKAAAFMTYWRQYRDDVDDIANRARRVALKDGRPVVCLNDVEAAWTQLVGPLAVWGM